MFDTFSGLFPINAFLLPSHHVPSSTSLKLFRKYSGNRYVFHMLCIILHELDLQYEEGAVLTVNGHC